MVVKKSLLFQGAEDEPAPSAYNIELADKVTMKTAPSLTHRWRLTGTAVWGASGMVGHNMIILDTGNMR